MKRFPILILLLCFLFGEVEAQSYAFGVKGGLTIGTQTWGRNNGRDPLFAYHGVAFIETVTEANEFALFAEGGWHVRGSSVFRPRFVDLNGNLFTGNNTRYEFRNVALVLGGKQKFPFGANALVYYSLGIRGEYTINTNLAQYESIFSLNRIFHPLNAFVRDLNYGVSIGGGFEFPFTEYISGIFEVSLHPDFSLQYRQPPIDNVFDPISGTDRNYGELLIRNNSLEISLGIRFLRIIEYIDSVHWDD